MSMTTTIGPTIDLISAAGFDNMNRIGAAGSHGRLRALEDDPRWDSAYVLSERAGALVGATPMYRCRAGAWPDVAYAAETWNRSFAAASPAKSVLMGGRSDLQSSVFLSDDAVTEELVRSVTRRCAEWAGDSEYLLLPYFSGPDWTALSESLGSTVSWQCVGHEASFLAPFPTAPGVQLPRRVRQTLSRDDRNSRSHGIEARVTSWDEANLSGVAAQLIAEHNARFGSADHSVLVESRMAAWQQTPGIDLLVFHAWSATGSDGFVTALVWRDTLELFEIGLCGEPGAERHSLYVELVFRAPMAFAAENELRCITTGLAAGVPKAARGASFSPVYCGVASLADVRAIL
jgi:hypothetical protein